MAVKGAGNSTFTYNSNALTAHMNQQDLQSTIQELEATNLASTAQESAPGLAKWTLSIGGDWNATLDGFLAPDAMSGTKRTGVATVSDGSSTVTYTWTSQAWITNYQIQTQANDKITWTATLNLSGNPTRTVA